MFRVSLLNSVSRLALASCAPVVFCGVAVSFVPTEINAQTLTVSTAQSSFLSTSTAVNNGPGNITITSSGSVYGNFSVTTANVSTGTNAITIDSNNSVSNAGKIGNTFGDFAVGLDIYTGNTTPGNAIIGNFTNSGVISVPGTDTPFDSSGQYGVLANGNGTFTGDIITTSTSNITISGIDPTAIGILVPMTGNLAVGGNVTSEGIGAAGVLVGSPITGNFTTSGIIAAISNTSSTTELNASSGSAVEIGANITGGYLNTGTLSAYGTPPVLLINSSAAGGLNNVILGTVADTTNPGFNFINRGNITAVANQPGISSLAVQIGPSAGATSGLVTSLAGGMYNNGQITAVATSANTNDLGAQPAASDATGIVVGYGALIGNITNGANGLISATTAGPLGGTAVALSLQSNSDVPVLINQGTILASANTSNVTISSLTSVAIDDESGNLTTINNSGTIAAVSTFLDGGNQTAIAASLTETTVPITFINSGNVTGDIFFGSAQGNQLTINGPNAIVDGRIETSGNGTVNVTISGNGTGGTLITSAAPAIGNLTVGSAGTLNLQVSPNENVVTAQNVTFATGSHLVLTPVALLPAGGNTTLIMSSTPIVFGNQTATLSSVTVPFLYNGSVTENGADTTLSLSLTPKTVSQLGLTGDVATIYNPAIQALLNDDQLGAAFAGLSSAAALTAALNQMLPVVSDAPRQMAEMISDSNFDAVGERERFLMLNGTPDADGAIWARGIYDKMSDTGALGYNGNGYGAVVGADFSAPGKGHFGAAVTIFDGNVTTANSATVEASWVLGTIYMGYRWDNFFLDGQFNIGGSKIIANRNIDIDGVDRTATSQSWTEFMVDQGATAGYIFNFGDFRIAPEATIDAMFLNDSQYSENNGGLGVDLNVGARAMTSLRGFVGVAGSGAFQLDQFRIVPQFIAGWSEEFLDSNPAIVANFVSVPDSAFTVSGPVADKSKLIAGGGINFSMNKWSVGVSYNISDQQNAIDQTASATITARF